MGLASSASVEEPRASVEEPRTPIATFTGHEVAVWALAVLPDGRFVSGSGDKKIMLWEYMKPLKRALMSGSVDTVSGTIEEADREKERVGFWIALLVRITISVSPNPSGC